MLRLHPAPPRTLRAGKKASKPSTAGERPILQSVFPASAIRQSLSPNFPRTPSGRRRWTPSAATGWITRHIVRGGERIGIYLHGARGRPPPLGYHLRPAPIPPFAESSEEEYDWSAIFAHADWLHLTGITPALGKNAAALALRAIHEAKKRNIPRLLRRQLPRQTLERGGGAPRLNVFRGAFRTSSSPNVTQAKELFLLEGGTTKPSPPRSGRSTAAKRSPSPSAAR